MGTIKKM